VSLLCVHADDERGETMQNALRSLGAQVVEVARRNFDTFLPMSPLSGLGQVSELATQHPAFADTFEWGARARA
jgi:hypothetical protein